MVWGGKCPLDSDENMGAKIATSNLPPDPLPTLWICEQMPFCLGSLRFDIPPAFLDQSKEMLRSEKKFMNVPSFR